MSGEPYSKEFELFLCQYLKNNIHDIRLIPLDHFTNDACIYVQAYFLSGGDKNIVGPCALFGLEAVGYAPRVAAIHTHSARIQAEYILILNHRNMGIMYSVRYQ